MPGHLIKRGNKLFGNSSSSCNYSYGANEGLLSLGENGERDVDTNKSI
jgi:hypothetical protein